ncbi:hypothetical protein ABER75_24115 [Niallia taxi]|uniref:DUF3810 domain-containing protein n=1 Tax=Niallia taxi TaxID=2499688 RepID=UPI001245D8AE|nr:DUF3810 domain-containing protein [Niallia taxi]MED4038408.1 hypothetical protein [Niallia taxi]
MNKLSYYYLEFIKILATIVILFALFGTINDVIIQLISGTSFPDASMFQGKSYLLLLFIAQFIGFAIITLVLYVNIISTIGFGLKKERRKFPKSWVNKLLTIALILIFAFYIVLLFS